MDVVSLGMLTIDEIVRDGVHIRSNVLGGAGTYLVVGARLVAPKDRAHKIGWVVHQGHDFPPEAKETIDSWGLHTRYIQTLDRRTTRATNTYIGEDRGFEFATPKLHVDHTMLDEDLLQACVFHIIATPERCISLFDGIQKRRELLFAHPAESVRKPSKATFVWEPMESSCNPANIEKFQEAMRLVDIFSPNEREFVELTRIPVQASGVSDFTALQQECVKHIQDCALQALVVRLGPRGVFVARPDQVSADQVLPAFYASDGHASNPKVVDVTGGGNAFLGGFCFALANEIKVANLGIYESAAAYGSVAASYAIEQLGMPKIDRQCTEGVEKWNGQAVIGRLQLYLRKLETMRGEQAAWSQSARTDS